MDSFKEQQRGITKIKTVKFSYTWIIHNFSFNNKKIGQALESPTFCMPDKQDWEWYLSAYPKGHNELFKDYLSLYLQLKTEIDSSISTEISLSILDSNNEERNTKVLKYIFEKVVGYGSHSFIIQSFLFDKTNNLLSDDKLTIMCKITAGVKIENFCQDTAKFKENRNKFTLSSELESLLENKYMTDITLIAGGKEFQAHTAILAARSPVFLAMLQTDMREKQSNRIEFADVCIDVLGEMLHYLYTGTVKNIKEYADDLVKLADMYDIKGLKLMCEEQFYNDLSINSATRIFILADRHNCKVLKPLILKFIVIHAKDIIQTAEFKKFEKDLPILIKEMMHAIV